METHDPGTAALAGISAPMDKLAMGLAAGLLFGAAVSGVTLFHLLLQPESAPNLSLLAQYFYGYEVSRSGAAVGFFWGFVSGFVAGWFVTFVRNLVVSIRMFIFRTKAELARSREFFDHL